MAVEVKICGLTRPEDAAVAAAAGAAYLGVVFAGGPREVTPLRAAEIVSAGQGIPVLGVFGGWTEADILTTAAQAGLSGVQLHGPPSSDTAAHLPAAGVRGWRGRGNCHAPGPPHLAGAPFPAAAPLGG